MNKLYEAIRLISNFGELSASDLALLLYCEIEQNEASRRTMTRRIITEMKESGCVKHKKLPSGAELFYLSTKGSKLAFEIGCENAKPNMTNETSNAWKHDSYIVQIICAITGANQEHFITEHQLISEFGIIDDRPDGLVKFRDEWHILEVENARKSGTNMRKQVNRVKQALNGEIQYGGINVSGAIICYPTNILSITHRTRLINAMHKDRDINDQSNNLILIGFKVANFTHARINLVSKIDEFNLSALLVEFGLPDKVPTGQLIGKRKKFSIYDVDLMRDDIYDPSCYFQIKNLRVDILAEDDESEVHEVIVTINSKHAFSNTYNPRTTISSAIDDVLIDIKRLRQDENGEFLSPNFSYQ